MAVVPSETFPAWWTGGDYPPPASWVYTFELFTAADLGDEWALAAAIFIAQYRRRHSCGPTFRELFLHLLPDTGGVPAILPREWEEADRRRALHGFRGHTTIEWRRRGYIGFDRQVTRSLRVGPEFRSRSRSLQQSRTSISPGATGIEPPAAGNDIRRGSTGRSTDDGRSDADASLGAQEVMVRLNIGSAMLRRLSSYGLLQALKTDGEARYPIWQFATEPGHQVVPGIKAVVDSTPSGVAPAIINAVMGTPDRRLEIDGSAQSPRQWLRLGGDPSEVASLLKVVFSP